MCGQWNGEVWPALGPNDVPRASFLPHSLALSRQASPKRQEGGFSFGPISLMRARKTDS